MKHSVKGRVLEVTDKVCDFLRALPKDSKTYVITIQENRTIEQNAKIHGMFRELAEYLGYTSVDETKERVKEALGYFTDTIVRLGDKKEITRRYHKTSEMSVKELALFIQKFEAWAADELQYVFEKKLDGDY